MTTISLVISMEKGIYEQLINKLISAKLNSLDKDRFYIKEQLLDKQEAATVLSNYVSEVIRLALNLIPNDEGIERQINLTNKIIQLLSNELKEESFANDLIDSTGKILTAIFIMIYL